MLRLGVQVSISGRIYQAVDRAAALGCNTLQIFSRNPRAFRKKPLNRADAREFRKRREKAGLFPLVIHSVYTQNLASASKRFHGVSIRDFIKDLGEAKALGADLVVTHTGSFKRSTYEKGIMRVIEALEVILKKTPEGITVLLENTSGSGHWLGHRFSQLAYIMEKVGKPKNLGICLDTCHAFSAGYNIREQEGLGKLVTEIESLIGLERLKLIHLNDTRDRLGSRRDRHWHIGQGQIGEDGLSRIINHPKLRDLPFILETPKRADEDDLSNLETVRRLYEG